MFTSRSVSIRCLAAYTGASPSPLPLLAVGTRVPVRRRRRSWARRLCECVGVDAAQSAGEAARAASAWGRVSAGDSPQWRASRADAPRRVHVVAMATAPPRVERSGTFSEVRLHPVGGGILSVCCPVC